MYKDNNGKMIMSINHTRSIGIIHSLGGCGGTLLAQCIGVLQNVILLSECNPLSASLFDYNLNPYRQIEKWYPKLFASIQDEFKPENLVNTTVFNRFITQIKSFIDQMNYHLVIRDYNYIDYFAVPFLEKPFMFSSLIQSIKNSFNIKQILLVRHPLTQYNSLRSHGILKDTLKPELFLDGYHKFLIDFDGCPLIKYEDIVASPKKHIHKLCSHLHLPFSDNFLEDFHQYQSITGNFKRIGENSITISKETIIEDQWTDELQTNPRYESLLRELYY